ncbi:ATP-binding protein [Streptomyces gardneri]|uniref:ATP-binding protein n=1 Tax=Streptomyces gardneri TaxID=66892 RepID=UPI0035E25053
MNDLGVDGLQRAPALDSLPEAVRLLAVALSTATRIEPALLRAIRVEVRPELSVAAESGLWFGSWSVRSSGRYMALHRELLSPLRELLCEELSQSQENAPLREAGQVIFRIHEHLSPALALEERVTWAAVCADAGLGLQEADADIDRLLERALRAAVQVPGRQERLRRWFAGAWQRFPERVRQTPTALELFGILGVDEFAGGRTGGSVGQGAHLDGVDDVIVAVRHDGPRLTIGDPVWPAEGVLVPDTQPRVLEVADSADGWERAQKVRVPRGGQLSLLVSHVPVYVRTARGVVYEVGARGASDVLAYPARSSGSAHRGLLGTRVTELTEGDALRFGIAARMITPVAEAAVGHSPDRWVLTDLVPRMARASDLPLPLFLREAAEESQLVVVSGRPSSGRTRAAWEAVRTALEDWWVWSPPLIDRSQALMDAVRDDRLGSHTVLWLDDLDVSLRGADGESLARALSKVLDDPALAPMLLVATGEPLSAMRSGLGLAARALVGRASFVQAATGKQGSALPAADAVSLACDRTIARVVAAEPRHKVSARGRLPAGAAVFVGRSQALQRLYSLWADSKRGRGQVSVLTGMGGVGKSALAVEAVHRATDLGWFPGGVLWLSLRGQPFTALDLLRALGVSTRALPPDEGERWVLCSALMHQVTGAGRQPVLLVLDDVSSASDAPLASLAPGLSVLITTRSQGPREADQIVVDPMTSAEAVQLLHQAVSAAAVADGPLEEDASATAALSEMCGRLPLALTIAAGLLAGDRSLTVSSLLHRLTGAAVRVDVLGGAAGSVRLALDWAYGQLTPAQARAFRLLGLMPGGDFSDSAVLVLIGASPDRLVSRFKRLHLLQPSPHGSGRWRMHDLVKQYASDLGRLHADEDERPQALLRLMGYYEQYAREADAWARGEQPQRGIVFSSPAQAMGWLEDERENLVEAVALCLREGLPQKGAAIALALAEFLTQTRQFDDLLRVMSAVLDSPAADDADEYTRTAVLNNFAVAMATTGDFDTAMEALQDAARLGNMADQSAAYALMLSNLGATLLLGRRLDEAVRVLQQASVRYSEIGDRAALSQVLSNLGIALLDLGHVEEALEELERALTLSTHASGSLHDQAVLLTTLGTAQLRNERREEGMSTLALAAMRAGQMGEAPGQGTVLESLGRAMLEVQQYDEAIGLFMRAVHVFRKVGDVHSEARSCNNLGLALLEVNQDSQGLLELEHARERYMVIGDQLSAAQCLNNVGNALRRLGRHDEAVQSLVQAVEELRLASDERVLAEALLNLGLSYVEQGEEERAYMALSESAAVHTSLGDITARARALHALGRSAHRADDELAVEHLRAATEAFRQGRDDSGLFDSLLLLSDRLSAAGQHGEAHAAFQEALRLEPSIRKNPDAHGQGHADDVS